MSGPVCQKVSRGAYNRPPSKGRIRGVQQTRSFGGFWEGGRHWSEVTADDAIDFLGEAKHENKPSFFYIAFNAPHDPRQSPQEYLDRYPIERISTPTPFLTEYPYAEQIGAGKICATKSWRHFPGQSRPLRFIAVNIMPL